MDIISKLFDWFYDVVWLMNEPFHDYFLRAAVEIIIPLIACTAAFALGNRSVAVQWALLIAGLLLASIIPVTDIEFTNRTAKAWVWVLCVLVLTFGPFHLGTLLFPRPKEQEEFIGIIYAILAGSFVVNTGYAAYVQWVR